VVHQGDKIDQHENSVLVEAGTADGIEKFESSISSAVFEGPCSEKELPQLFVVPADCCNQSASFP
jgi:hypothetical protein